MTSETAILNVDDDAAGRYATSRVLRQAGFQVEEAATGNETLHMAAAKTFSLVVLDVNLPDVSGFEVCRLLKSDPRTSYWPVLHLTATSVGPKFHVEGLDAGADAYLTQPIEPEVLVATVRSLLRVRRAEEALRRSEERFRRLSESNLVGIISGSGDVVHESNAAFLRMLGYSPADVARRSLNYRAITAPESAERDGKAKQERLERGASALYEKAYLRRDGSRVPALVGAAALDQSREDSWIEFVVDLTERKKLEQQFLEAQKLESLGLLAGGIAHDYNNLLTGIMGSASLLLYKTPPESSDAQLLGTVIEASERAAELTRQILAYSGKGRFITRRFVVSEAIQQIGDLLHSSLPPGVSLLMDLEPKLPQVNGDWNQIQQIVTNLVTNSVEAIESKSGEVRVSTGVKRIGPGANPDVAAGAYVFIEVWDSGRGIDAETRAKMFDPFFSTKFIGRGLGLAAVSGIVRGHRGFIETESAPGQGATLRVFLPVAD